MKPKRTFYVWKCSHCDYRNKEVYNFHYEFPQRYHAIWKCSKCGNDNFIDFCFRVYPITEKKTERFYNNGGYKW